MQDRVAATSEIARALCVMLLGLECADGTGYSITHARGAGRFHLVVIRGIWIEFLNAHTEDHLGMGTITAIGRLCDVRQVPGIGAIVHDTKVQVGASRIRGGPANDR